MEFTYLQKKMIFSLSCCDRTDTICTLSRLLPYISDLETRAIAYSALQSLHSISDEEYIHTFSRSKVS